MGCLIYSYSIYCQNAFIWLDDLRTLWPTGQLLRILDSNDRFRECALHTRTPPWRQELSTGAAVPARWKADGGDPRSRLGVVLRHACRPLRIFAHRVSDVSMFAASSQLT